jgi:hypothetical protein
MDDDKEQIPESVFRALQRSGFPFQTAIHHVITGTGAWTVQASEYPWQDWSGKDEFLDLVIQRGSWFATIECKKTEKAVYIFLLPLGVAYTGQTERVRCLRAGSNFRLHSEDWGFSPGSPECEFCIVSTSESGKDQRLLERDASLLVRATNAFALNEEKRLDAKTRFGGKKIEDDRRYFSIIVTNAPLYTARYKPSEISLQSGEFGKQPQEIESARWVRFRKAFTSPVGLAPDDRTVFVVHADNLEEFLKSFEKGLTDNENQRNSLLLRARGE